MNAAGSPEVTVIGGGLAGCAAACSAAAAGGRVTVIEQRPVSPTPLHDTELLAEPVGSNDFGAPDVDRASGLLRAELAELGCPLVRCVAEGRIGTASVSVDRYGFAEAVTVAVSETPGIELRREEVRTLPEGIVVVATGPTTWTPLARAIHAAAGVPYSFAYWGRAPLLYTETVPNEWLRARAYPGADESLFVPLSEDELAGFVAALTSGERQPPPGLGQTMLADEAALAEDLASSDPGRLRGRVLSGPRGDARMAAPAALRLAPDGADGSRYSLADVITTLSERAQEALVSTVAALAGAELVRPGVVHRLPCLAPGEALLPTLQLARTPRMLLAGSLAGGLGYSEAMATGHVAGLNAARLAAGEEPGLPPQETLTGQLCRALSQAAEGPVGLVQANFGMLPEVPGDDETKQVRHQRKAERALAAMREFAGSSGDHG